jgi:hypothetical protein
MVTHGAAASPVPVSSPLPELLPVPLELPEPSVPIDASSPGVVPLEEELQPTPVIPAPTMATAAKPTK